MTNYGEEYLERIELVKILYSSEEDKELWKNQFPILRNISDKEAMELLVNTVMKGVLERWNK